MSQPHFERALSYGDYSGNLRGLIHLLKYESVLPAANVLGQMLARAVKELISGREALHPILVPVPLHRTRHRWRGFNQAELIARHTAKLLALEVSTAVLVRRRDTVSQVGLNREERIANMSDAFRVPHKDVVKDRTIILVDDVMTTGATLSECARVLKKAGAKQVLAATVARAMQNDVPPVADFAEEEEEAAVPASF
jgi:ComF family protein